MTEPDRDVIRGLDTFGRMEVSDACNLTPTCSTLCPTDAIQRTNDGELQFNHADCVNCGVCESGCPEGAITIESGLERSRLPENRDGEEWEPVFEGEMLECVRCGTPFTSRGSMESVRDEVGDLVEGVAGDTEHSIFEYCDECRAQVVFQGVNNGR
ncbi:formate hydrogenlyase complex iron-sulfur subunit [Halolamina pelagica]|uniref:Formate hydrogenlyase complex iron-sulfur subunit n=1 Tax=Halolamina pelagica TaxID=699431 RepID=A0A0P7GQS2_9EURY|nr:formate hydrogenlyase complex iron-sulfur subunit [Halolamina pelagica]